MDGSPLRQAQAPLGAATSTKPGRVIPPPTDSEGDQLLGRVLDDGYRLDSVIGSGGMGVVYRATHVVIEKPVAVKILRETVAHYPDVVQRFLQEAQLASSLEHPNVVDISDYGELPGVGAYYVMEFLPGHSLADEIDDNGALEPRRAVDVAIQTADGLGAAHARGIVHRDLKPDNVFLCPSPDGRREIVKLLDFGIARVAGRKTRLTAIGAVVGTPEYMSPEQAQGTDVDSRSDLYALGAILFEMLTGRVPFRGDSALGTLTKQMFEAPPMLRAVEPKVPHLPRLEDVIRRLLAKERGERPQSAAEVIALLRAASHEDLSGAAQSRPRATVAMGSDSMDAPNQAHAVASPGVAVPAVMGRPWPPASAIQPGQSSALAAAMSVSSASSSAASPPLDASLDVARIRPGPGSPPVTLLVLGAALFAGLVTAGVIVRMNRSEAAPSKEPVTAAAAGSLEPEQEDRLVTLRFESTPAGAEVLLGGETRLGITPFTKEMERQEGPSSYLFRLAGHADAVRQVAADRDRSLSVELLALPAAAGPGGDPRATAAKTEQAPGKRRSGSRDGSRRPRRSAKAGDTGAATPTSEPSTAPSHAPSPKRPKTQRPSPQIVPPGDLKDPFGPN